MTKKSGKLSCTPNSWIEEWIWNENVNVRVESQKLCLGLDMAKDKERIHFRKYTVGNCLGSEREK